MQWIGKALPLYYAADTLRKVIILNAGLNVIGLDLLILALYSLVAMTAAIPIFERAMTLLVLRIASKASNRFT